MCLDERGGPLFHKDENNIGEGTHKCNWSICMKQLMRGKHVIDGVFPSRSDTYPVIQFPLSS